MELGLLSKISMFLSSYFLLFLAVAVKYDFNNITLALLITSFCGVLYTLFIIKTTRVNRDSRKVIQVNAENEKVLSYLVTYLLPFLGFNLTNLSDSIALVILFMAVGLLYIKADLIFINPVLMLFGYNIYSVTFENNQKRILLSKRNIQEIRNTQKTTFYELKDRFLIVEVTERRG